MTLLGPGEVIPGSGSVPTRLRAGALLIRTTDTPAIIEAAQARLTVPFHAIVEVVSAHGRPTLIASYVGQAVVRWAGKEHDVLLSAGYAATAVESPARSALPQADTSKSEDTILKESQLLNAAMAQLRQKQDPSGALTLLDSYQEKFPHGLLQPEVALLRVTALLRLGKRREALVALDQRQAPPRTTRMWSSAAAASCVVSSIMRWEVSSGLCASVATSSSIGPSSTWANNVYLYDRFFSV